MTHNTRQMMGFSKAVLLFSFCLASCISCFDSVDTFSRKDSDATKDKLPVGRPDSIIDRPYIMHPHLKHVKSPRVNRESMNKLNLPNLIAHKTFQNKLAAFRNTDNEAKSTVISIEDAADAFAELWNNPIINPVITGGKAKTVIQTLNTPNFLSSYNKRSDKKIGHSIADTSQLHKNTKDDNDMVEHQLKTLANGHKGINSFVKSVTLPFPSLVTHPKLLNNITGNKSKRIRPGMLNARCDLDSIDMDLSFSEVVEMETGDYLLTCSGTVTVNKCEGACVSIVSPSVNHVEGFEKTCSCCRDVSLTVRSVSLTSCLLGSNEVVGYSLSRDIVEPTSCGCTQCTN